MWALRVVIRANLSAIETAVIHLAVDVVVGSGQSQATARFPYDLVSTAPGVYAPINDLQLMPACDIQATALILGSGALVDVAQQAVEMGLFVAPHTEVHAPTRIYEKLCSSTAAARACATSARTPRDRFKTSDCTTRSDRRCHF